MVTFCPRRPVASLWTRCGTCRRCGGAMPGSMGRKEGRGERGGGCGCGFGGVWGVSCACKDVFRAYGSCHRFAVPTVLLQPDDHDQVITMQFAWDGNLKPVSTSFIGVRYAGIAILVSVGLEDCNRSVTCVYDVRVVQSGVRVCAVHAVLPGKRGANGLYRGSVQHHCAVPQDSGWTNRHLFSRGPALETSA